MKRECWIDIAKCAAILAVLTDHVRGILYANGNIQIASFFSVSLFILVMGVTTYWSFEKSSISIGGQVIKRAIGIVCPYLVAVFIYHCIAFQGFSFVEYVRYAMNFSISGPHYYVLLYLQLLVVAPIIFYFLKDMRRVSVSKKILVETLFGGGLVIIASICTNHTNIASIYGGGGRLIGGSYIFCLYIGMLIGKYYQSIKKTIMKINPVIVWIVFTTLSILVWRMICKYGYILDRNNIFGAGINPPGICLMTYAFCIMIAIYAFVQFIESLRYKWIYKIIKLVCYIGSQTLYIFLYHRLFIDYVLYKYLSETDRIAKICIYYVVMIGGSILIGVGLRYMWTYTKKSYDYHK